MMVPAVSPELAVRSSFARVGNRIRRQVAAFGDPALEALATLRAHKMRSALTLLGITLSVSVLILVVSVIWWSSVPSDCW
jgi:hypothetical protein